jgi:hypothetical protein
MDLMSVTLETFHPEMSWSKAVAFWNMVFMLYGGIQKANFQLGSTVVISGSTNSNEQFFFVFVAFFFSIRATVTFSNDDASQHFV